MVDFYRTVDYNTHVLKNSHCRAQSPVGYGREGNLVAEIRVGENESLENALKRFKRMTAREGTLAELRKREHYEKPSVKRKKKAEAARKRRR